MTTTSAAAVGLGACSVCGLVSRARPPVRAACPRCGAGLRLRKAGSLGWTTAFLATAALLFVPANVLPVMTTTTIARSHSDTILSGVAALWRAGAWPLSLLVLIASLVVPGLKIAALGLLVATTRRRSAWRRHERTRLYRLVERVGRWSMLDIFVVAVLVALVQIKAVAQIEAGPAAVAFGAVVVLTIFAANSFDARLIWDPIRPDYGPDEED